jgi:protein-S-isoprenylcysteine O-methyltransferase Ste14
MPEENIIAISVGLIAQRARPLSSPRIFRNLGWALLIVGIAFNVAAIRDRGPGPIDEPTRLITAGVHARTRNPMYLGWSAIHIGIGLAARLPWVLFTWPVAALFVHRAVRAEEVFLAQEFGSAYEAYRETVPRYLT